MRFLIVTGMGGAGKTQVIHALEDIGYYCIDNFPIVFLEAFAKMCAEEKKFENVAIVVDIRGGESLKEIGDSLKKIKKNSINYEILFLEAEEEVIIKRYKETRRTHILAPNGSIECGIALEREQLSFLRGEASRVIDTSTLLTKELKSIISDLYGSGDKNEYFKIELQSFGFKYGLPRDADLVFDVRFLPNPYYVEELKEHNGTEIQVFNYVTDNDIARSFIKKLEDMLLMLMPQYIEEGKNQLVICFGCTGGRHRSVAVCESIAKILKSNGYNTVIRHRDMIKD